MNAKELFRNDLRKEIVNDNSLNRYIIMNLKFSLNGKIDKLKYSLRLFEQYSFSIEINDNIIRLDFYNEIYYIKTDKKESEIYDTDISEIISIISNSLSEKINGIPIGYVLFEMYDLKKDIEELNNKIANHSASNSVCFDAIGKNLDRVKKDIDDFLVPKVNNLLEESEERNRFKE